MTAFKALQEQNRFSTARHSNTLKPLTTAVYLLNLPFFFFFNFSHDAMDSFYDYIWDVTILEYLTRILYKIFPLKVMQKNIFLFLESLRLKCLLLFFLMNKYNISKYSSTVFRYSPQTRRD